MHKNDGTYTGAGTSEPRVVLPGIENSFDTQLPIRQGEFIGVDVPSSADTSNLPRVATRDATGALRLGWRPALQDGRTLAPNFNPSPDLTFVYNADVEPDCDNDGFGDETQDPELPFSEACGKGNRSLILDANKNKVKQGKKVTLSGRLSSAARQGPCESGQTVELQRKRPKQTGFATFTQLQTDAQGSFSLKKKVKKTFEFRAQVVETSACTAALSNSEKVKVKKKN